jgi:hypothetical protein
VPLYNPRDLSVLSARAANYQYHPYRNLLSTSSGSVSLVNSAAVAVTGGEQLRGGGTVQPAPCNSVRAEPK